MQVDRAVSFALLTVAWRVPAGVVTLWLIVRYFSPEVQGFYYTFASLLALQTFFELALFQVVINLASHEWASLKLDCAGRIVGSDDAHSRLVSLGHFVFKWYAAASVLFVICVSIGGYVFFSNSPYSNVAWQAQWVCLVALTGLLIWTLPFSSMLEGCNQVESINKFRLIQSVLGSLALWLSIAFGGELWAAVVSAGVSLLCALYLLLVRYQRYFEAFFKPSSGGRIHWKHDIWPMQWRLALLGLVNFFLYSLFTPVMFHYYGAVEAGRMGLSLQIVNLLGGMAFVWVQTSVPRFGMLVAEGNYTMLDQLWSQKLRVSVLFLSASGIMFWFAAYALNALDTPFAGRLLTPLPTAIFVLAATSMLFIQCLAAYLRAHRREMFLIPGVVASLACGLLVWQLGSRYGATGAAAAYLVVTLSILPWNLYIWRTARNAWHGATGKIR